MKSMAKALLALLAQLLVLPLWAGVRLLVALGADRDRQLLWASQAVAPIAGPLGEAMRRALHARLLERVAADCCLCYGVLFSRHGALVGRRAYVGPHCNLGWVELGDDVLLGSGVHILSGKGQHSFADPDAPIRDQGGDYARVRVGQGAWIGNAAVVMADVGEGAVVGAGSVVVHAVPPYALAGGNPARVLGWRPGHEPQEAV